MLSLFEYLCRLENSLRAGKRCEKADNGGEPWPPWPSSGMPGGPTRHFIRLFVGAALCAALIACAVAPVPEDLPAVALRQAGLYRLEIALIVFYGALLLITPAFSGLIRGRLPIEISTRGAKFAEETDQSAQLNETAIQELKQATSDLTDNLADAKTEIDELREQVTVRD